MIKGKPLSGRHAVPDPAPSAALAPPASARAARPGPGVEEGREHRRLASRESNFVHALVLVATMVPSNTTDK